MNIKRKFKKIFKVFLDNNRTNKILYLLQKLYDNKTLSKELVLNLIKGLIIIFYIDNSFFDLYFEILDYFDKKMDNKIKTSIIKCIKKLDLSLQFDLEEYYVDKVIVYTNNLLSMVTRYNINIIFNIWIIIIEQIKKIKLNKENKILLYCELIKLSYDIIHKEKEENCINQIKNNINIIINLIKKIK